MNKVLLVAILTFTNTAYAQQVWIEGSIDCGLWSTARKANSAQYLEHSLVGLVNGMVLASVIDIWGGTDGNKVSREQLYLWMDGWCQKNPLKKIMGGALDFADERTNGAFGKRFQSK
jgi:hypothetical protein